MHSSDQSGNLLLLIMHSSGQSGNLLLLWDSLIPTLSLSSPLFPMTLSKMCLPTWASTADSGSSRR